MEMSSVVRLGSVRKKKRILTCKREKLTMNAAVPSVWNLLAKIATEKKCDL